RGRSATRSSRMVSPSTWAAAALKTDTTSRVDCEGVTSALVRIGLVASRRPMSAARTALPSGQQGRRGTPGNDLPRHLQPSLSGPGPCHVLSVIVCAAFQALLAVWVVENRVHGRGELLGITEPDQQTSAVGERFEGVQVGGGVDRLPGAERVGKGPTCDLLRVQVRGHVDVGADRQLDDVLLRH